MPRRDRTSSLYGIDTAGQRYLAYYELSNSNWSLTPAGKPDLTAQNPYQYIESHVTSRKLWNSMNYDEPKSMLQATTTDDAACDRSSIENRALAKFNRKLRKGHASLGVTLGSWSQSAAMIKQRISTAAYAVEKATHSLLRDSKRLKSLRRQKDPLANAVLETEFGWRPLFEDVSTAFGVMCRDNLPGSWVRGSHRETFYVREDVPNVDNGFRGSRLGWGRATVSARVDISNPNTYLLNQLGLFNPAEVIWDLIPWSFLVSMVSNMNDVLSSFTAEVGLNVKNRSTTYVTYTENQNFRWYRPLKTYPFGCSSSSRITTYKSRSVGTLTPVKFEFHWPSGNWETCLILSSLLVQRFDRINKLIRI